MSILFDESKDDRIGKYIKIKREEIILHLSTPTLFAMGIAIIAGLLLVWDIFLITGITILFILFIYSLIFAFSFKPIKISTSGIHPPFRSLLSTILNKDNDIITFNNIASVYLNPSHEWYSIIGVNSNELIRIFKNEVIHHERFLVKINSYCTIIDEDYPVHK